MDENKLKSMKDIDEVLNFDLPKIPEINLSGIENPLYEQNEILKKTLINNNKHLKAYLKEAEVARKESKRNFVLLVISTTIALITSVLSLIL